jgi:hypothetical protein
MLGLYRKEGNHKKKVQMLNVRGAKVKTFAFTGRLKSHGGFYFIVIFFMFISDVLYFTIWMLKIEKVVVVIP